ncbi:MAG: hypothetical protein IT204_10240 [Fimbriimonadaceae bacterium]|nr:hypothetical protein [Fimbriimonadaceae bacterium]
MHRCKTRLLLGLWLLAALAGCAPQGGSPREALPVTPEHAKQNQDTSKGKTEEVKSTPTTANPDAAENH